MTLLESEEVGENNNYSATSLLDNRQSPYILFTSQFIANALDKAPTFNCSRFRRRV